MIMNIKKFAVFSYKAAVALLHHEKTYRHDILYVSFTLHVLQVKLK